MNEVLMLRIQTMTFEGARKVFEEAWGVLRGTEERKAIDMVPAGGGEVALLIPVPTPSKAEELLENLGKQLESESADDLITGISFSSALYAQIKNSDIYRRLSERVKRHAERAVELHRQAEASLPPPSASPADLCPYPG